VSLFFSLYKNKLLFLILGKKEKEWKDCKSKSSKVGGQKSEEEALFLETFLVSSILFPMKEIIGIIGGEGRMGKAFAQFFAQKGYSILVSDINTSLSNIELVQKSDVVILSVPISLFDSVVQEIAPHVKKNALLCDITSIKEKPLKTMLSVFSGAVLGLHPMFGPTNLLPGQTVVFCSGRNEKWEAARMKEILSDFSCVSFSAKEHDKAMALVQGLQHFMEVAYGATLKKIGFPLSSLLTVASPVYRMQMALMGRVLSQDEDMYARIVFGSEYSQKSIDIFLECAQEIREQKEEKFLEDFCNARNFFGDFCAQAQTETDEFIDLLASRKTDVSSVSFDEKVAAIGVLGPKWTWSHLAAEHFFPGETKKLFTSFSSVFLALKNGEIEKALLPVENTISGSVREVWEEMVEHATKIENVYEFPILHVLASSNKEEEIRKIFGHSAALAQCKKTLSAQFSNVVFIAVASNSLAVEQTKATPNSAAVCSQKAAAKGHLFIRKKDIADKKGNATRFALVSLQNITKTKKDATHTSLFFELKNIPGLLVKALQIFSDFGVNMVRLESCPVGGDFLEYGFYVDIEGSVSEEMRQALKTVAKHVAILGNYRIIPALPKD
jgi:prephenate dehydratase/prephenate dehydrogenase